MSLSLGSSEIKCEGHCVHGKGNGILQTHCVRVHAYTMPISAHTQ